MVDPEVQVYWFVLLTQPELGDSAIRVSEELAILSLISVTSDTLQ